MLKLSSLISASILRHVLVLLLVATAIALVASPANVDFQPVPFVAVVDPGGVDPTDSGAESESNSEVERPLTAKPEVVDRSEVAGSAAGPTTNTDVETPGPPKPAPATADLSGPKLDQVSGAGGEYSFSIPLRLPPGINGLTPNVSLEYSSTSSKKSIIGPGFTLSTTDCIYRAPPAKYDPTAVGQYHFVRGVPSFTDAVDYYTPTDTFWLNGERLVKCQGTQSCPTGTYRTYHNNFERIVQNQNGFSSGGGWVITAKDGTEREYADTRWRSDRSFSGFHDVTSWCLSREKKDGNVIDYIYSGDTTGDRKLGEIRYGGQSDANHIWNIVLAYEDRPDPYQEEIGRGYESKAVRQRLKEIKSQRLPSTVYSKYTFGYETSPSVSGKYRLKSFQEYGTGWRASPPYLFSYAQDRHGFSPSTSVSGLGSSNQFVQVVRGSSNTEGDRKYPWLQDNDLGQLDIPTVVADINGDGIVDLLRHDENLTSVWLGLSGGWTYSQPWTDKIKPLPWFHSYITDQGVRFGDLNGDGHIDVIQAGNSAYHEPNDGCQYAGPPTPARCIPGPHYYVALWNPALNGGTGGFDPSLGASFRDSIVPPEYWPGGPVDWSNGVVGFVSDFGNPNGRSYDTGQRLIDINGDGLADIVGGYIETTGITRKFVLLNTGHQFVRAPEDTFSNLLPLVAIWHPNTSLETDPYRSLGLGVEFADINGDGLPDMIQALKSGTPDVRTDITRTHGIWINTGREFRPDAGLDNSLKALIESDSADLRFNDLIWWYFGRGYHLGGTVYTSVYPSVNVPTGVNWVDLNGDGRADLSQSLWRDFSFRESGSGWIGSFFPTSIDGWTKTNLQYSWPLSPESPFPLSSEFLIPEPESYLLDVPRQYRSGLQEYVGGPARGSGLRFADIDGDGDLDLIGNGGSEYLSWFQSPRVYINNRSFDQDLVTFIKNPLGGSTSVSYASASPDFNNDTFRPRVVVSSITSDNGKPVITQSPSGTFLTSPSDPASGHWASTKHITYSGGRFDPNSDTYAFRSVTVEEPATEGGKIYKTTWFKNSASDFCRFGVPEYSIVSEGVDCQNITTGGPVYSMSLCLSSIVDPNVSVPGIGVGNLFGDGGVANLFRIHQETKTTYEAACDIDPSIPSVTQPQGQLDIHFELTSPTFSNGDRPPELQNSVWAQQSAIEYGYDDFGNRTLAKEYIWGTGTFAPYRSYVTKYAAPDLTKWRIEAECASEIHEGVPGPTSLRRRTNYYYDQQSGLCTLGANGWITKKEQLGYAQGVVDSSTSKTFTYTLRGNVKTSTDSRGALNQVYWAAPGLTEIVPSSIVNPLGHTESYTYNTYGTLASQTDPNGTKTKFEYDDFLRLTHKESLVDDLTPNEEIVISYESQGNPDAQRIVEAKRIDSTRFIEDDTYLDGLGRAYLKVQKGGSTAYSTSVSFNLRGLESKKTLPYSGEHYDMSQAGTTNEYDALGRITKITLPGEYVTRISHGIYWDYNDGHMKDWSLIRAENSKGPANSRFLVKDSFGRLIKVGECIDGNCALPSFSDPNILWTSYSYDVADNHINTIMADGTSKTRSFYDGLGRLIGLKDPDLTNCIDTNIDNINSGCPHRYYYDDESNLVRITDAKYGANPSIGNDIRFSYDQLNRPITKTVQSGIIASPSGTIMPNQAGYYTYIYDDLATPCSPGNTNKYAKGRLVIARYSGSGIAAENVKKCLVYDKFGRVLSETDNTTAYNQTTGVTLSRTYNNDGSVATTAIPLLGTEIETLTMGYDDFGREKSITSSKSGVILSNIAYDERGREKVRTLANGYSQTYSYRTGDPSSPLGDQRLAQISAFGNAGNPLMTLNYDYDDLGNILKIQNTKNGRSEVMTYDALMRLLTYGVVVPTNPTKISEQVFSYDSVGSRATLTKSIANLRSGTLAADPATRVVTETSVIKHGRPYLNVGGTHAVRCTQASTTGDCTVLPPTFVYDANGNMTARTLGTGQTQTFLYNAANKLIKTISPDGTAIYYTYGSSDEKVAFADGAGTTFYFGPLEIRGSTRFVDFRLGDTLIASREGNGEVQYHFQDQLGSTRYSERRTSHVATTIDYDPFGNTSSLIGPEKLEYTYNGKEADSSGILDYNARSYDPKLGMFLQPDNIIPDLTNPQTLNRYAYVMNNPMGNTDPTGHMAAAVLAPALVGLELAPETLGWSIVAGGVITLGMMIANDVHQGRIFSNVAPTMPSSPSITTASGIQHGPLINTPAPALPNQAANIAPAGFSGPQIESIPIAGIALPFAFTHKEGGSVDIKHYPSYEAARNAMLADAAAAGVPRFDGPPGVGKFGSAAGKANGMTGSSTSGRSASFRVEFAGKDAKVPVGPHINLKVGARKDFPHYAFPGTQQTVDTINRRFESMPSDRGQASGNGGQGGPEHP